MASLHLRAKRRAEAFENLERASADVTERLGLEAPTTAMLGVIARDPELRAIAEIEAVVELLQAVGSQLNGSTGKDEALTEVLEEFRTILTPFNRSKEGGEDETLIETLYRLISERAAYLGISLEKAREIAAKSDTEFTLTAESYPSQILQSGVIEPMAARISDLEADLEATRLRAELAEAKAVELAQPEAEEAESDIADDSKSAPKKSK